MALTWINPLHEKQITGDSALRRDSAALRNSSLVSSITALRINQEAVQKRWREKILAEKSAARDLIDDAKQSGPWTIALPVESGLALK
jgi:hypothetical protein